MTGCIKGMMMVVAVVVAFRIVSLPAASPGTAAFAGYNASWSAPSWKRPDAASFPKDRLHFAVSAHGFELMREAAYYTRFRDSVKSGGYDYAFDPKQNADPERA